MRTPSAFSRVLVLSVLALAGCKSDLNTRLSEADANEIMDVLYAENIPATKYSTDQKTWSIQIDDDHMQQAVRLLRDQGLPREGFANIGELFKKEGMISSPSEERIRYVFAISQELSRTLRQIDGVISARVHPVIPFNDPLADRVKPSSVSVFIKHQRDANLQLLGPAIRNLVLRSIEGLREDSISLTFIPTAAVSRPAAPVAKPAFGWEWVLIGTLSALLSISVGTLVFHRLQGRAGGTRGPVVDAPAPGTVPAPRAKRKRWAWLRRTPAETGPGRTGGSTHSTLPDSAYGTAPGWNRRA